MEITLPPELQAGYQLLWPRIGPSYMYLSESEVLALSFFSFLVLGIKLWALCMMGEAPFH